MRHFFSATLIDYKIFNKNGIEPLGSWCVPKSDLFIKNNLNSNINFENYAQKKAQYAYIQSLYLRIIPEISKELNKFHNLTITNAQWENIIGYWLICFLNALYKRWKTIEKISDEFSDITIIVCDRDKNFIPRSLSMLDSRISHDHELNSYIYEIILEYFPAISCEKSKKFTEMSAVGKPKKRTTLNKVKLFIKWKLTISARLLYEAIIVKTGIFAKQDFIILTHWNSTKSMLLLMFEIKKLIFLRKINSMETSSNIPKSYSKIMSINAQNNFERYLNQHLMSFIPTSLLSDFELNQAEIVRRKWNFSPNATFSDTDHTGGTDLTRIWMGLYGNNKKQMCVVQHGGAYGQTEFQWSLFYENRIAKIFYCWGWANTGQNSFNYENLPSIRLINKNNIRRNRGKSLIVILLFPEYEYQYLPLFTQPSNLDEHILNLQFLSEFINNLDDKNSLRVKPQNTTFEVTAKYMQTFHREIFIGDISKKTLYKNCRILISTYNGTNTLECLYSGIPTLLIWDERFLHSNKDAKNCFSKLEKAGVLYFDSKAAAEFLNLEQELIDQWWQKHEVQEAINYYLDRFGNTKGGSKGFAKCFAKELLDDHALWFAREKVITTDD